MPDESFVSGDAFCLAVDCLEYNVDLLGGDVDYVTRPANSAYECRELCKQDLRWGSAKKWDRSPV